METLGTRKKGISGSTLKIIAIVAMLIDHIGAVILERYLISQGLTGFSVDDLQGMTDFIVKNGVLVLVYFIMRMVIGRIGFPIFCFLLVEGFEHTKNVWKYALRLFVFAIISEIPFDLAFNGQLFYWDYQNVFFTLLIGLMVMILFRAIDQTKLQNILKIFLKIISLAMGMIAGMLLKTDYGNPFGIGVICIVVIYIFRKKKVYQIIAGCAAFIWEITAPLAFIPIALYNGTRGLKMKYFFYAFYPVHLLILFIIAKLLKLV